MEVAQLDIFSVRPSDFSHVERWQISMALQFDHFKLTHGRMVIQCSFASQQEKSPFIKKKLCGAMGHSRQHTSTGSAGNSSTDVNHRQQHLHMNPTVQPVLEHRWQAQMEGRTSLHRVTHVNCFSPILCSFPHQDFSTSLPTAHLGVYYSTRSQNMKKF